MKLKSTSRIPKCESVCVCVCEVGMCIESLKFIIYKGNEPLRKWGCFNAIHHSPYVLI